MSLALSIMISVDRTGKNQLNPGQESMRDAPVFPHCSSLKIPSPKPTGVLEHCREVETNGWFCIFRGFILSIPNVTKDILYSQFYLQR
jgi:hypothetical protein